MRIPLLFLCLITLAFTEPLRAADPSYHQVKAKTGDGVYSVLRRYQLDGHRCNFDLFYKLNRLSRNAALIVNRSYYLPVQVYTYNGRSIRSTIGNSDYDMAVSIQRYNEAMHQAKLRSADYRKDNVLWVPHHLVDCGLTVPAELPRPASAAMDMGATSDGKRNFSIFGKRYAHVPLLSSKLKGHVYYIVSGHGGPDPGAMGQRGNYRLCEDEYAYDVALRLCRHLLSHGATAYMIIRDPNDGIRDDKFLKCDYDEVNWGNTRMVRNQKARLFQRSDIINDLFLRNRQNGVVHQTTVVIHVDSRSQKQRTDVFFYHHHDNKAGKELAQGLQSNLKAHYKRVQANRGYHGTVSGRDLHMLRETKPTAVYIELANIRNVFDQQRIIIPKNRELIAAWLLDGLLQQAK